MGFDEKGCLSNGAEIKAALLEEWKVGGDLRHLDGGKGEGYGEHESLALYFSVCVLEDVKEEARTRGEEVD